MTTRELQLGGCALLCVLGLAAAAGLGLYLASPHTPVAAAGARPTCKANDEPGQPLAPKRPPPAAAASDWDGKQVASLLPQVAAHRFWRVKVTEDQVRKLVDDLRGRPRDTLAWVDDHFKVQVTSDPEVIFKLRSFHENGVSASFLDPMRDKRHIALDMSFHSTRPTPAELLAELKQVLDEAEYKSP